MARSDRAFCLVRALPKDRQLWHARSKTREGMPKLTYKYTGEWPPIAREDVPPDDAQPANMVVFRSVAKLPPTEMDFLSDIETNKPNRDPTICQHWGCSVWPSKRRC